MIFECTMPIIATVRPEKPKPAPTRQTRGYLNARTFTLDAIRITVIPIRLNASPDSFDVYPNSALSMKGR